MKPLLVLSLLIVSATTALSGCAGGKLFQSTDPATGVSAVDPDKVAAAQSTATTFGAIFGPIGAAVGIGLSGVIGAYAAKLKGENKGYGQGVLDSTGKPLASDTK